jgi:serine/threonine-protein kinase
MGQDAANAVCPDRETLSSFALGRLPAEELASITAHLTVCPACESSLLDLPNAEDSLVANLRRFAPPISATATADASVTGLADDLDAPGQLWADYRLTALVGRGGMGEVYRAIDTRLKRVVALKTIRHGELSSAEAMSRFRSECEAIARLEHPHIVRLYEFGQWEGKPFFSMEFVVGGTLGAMLNRRALPVDEAVALVLPLARAIEYAHSRRVVHRDLKPGNILIAADGTPKIADFGLAKLLDADTSLTQSDAVLGTAGYMAPEQARGDSRVAQESADIYALGAILYETMTGRPPFRGANRTETLQQVQSDDPTPANRLNRDVSADANAVCLKCLEKEPARRYLSAAALVRDLERLARGEPTEARRAGWRTTLHRFIRRRRRAITATAVIAGLSAAAVLVAWFADSDRPLRGIEARLAAGESITLIGESGPPAWSRMRVGDNSTRTSVNRDGSFALHTWEISLLELVADPQTESFVLSASVRHDDAKTAGEVGLYVTRYDSATGAAPLHRFVQLSYNDILSKRKIADQAPIPPPKSQHIPDIVDLAPRLVMQAGVESAWHRRLLGASGVEFKVAGAPGGVWRDLQITVAPDSIEGVWNGQRVGAIPARQLAESFGEGLGELASIRPATGPLDHVSTEHRPRGGVGLYVWLGSASFRNVVIKPIQSPIQKGESHGR